MLQDVCQNGVVASRNQLNIELSPALKALMHSLQERYKRKGVIGRAAIILLASLPKKAQEEFMQTIAIKEFVGKVDEYASRAESGEVWDDISLNLPAEWDLDNIEPVTVIGFWKALKKPSQKLAVLEAIKAELQKTSADPFANDIQPIDLPQTAKINQVDEPKGNGEKTRKPKAGS